MSAYVVGSWRHKVVRDIADEAGRNGSRFRPRDLLPGAAWKERRGKVTVSRGGARDAEGLGAEGLTIDCLTID